RRRPGTEPLQEHVVARLWLEAPDTAPLVVQVAEHDRVRRARLLAGGHHLAVAHAPPGLLGVDPRADDPLHAVGALLHHAAAPHRHLGAVEELEAVDVPARVLEAVEAPDLVGTGVRGVAGADAAGADHRV